MPTKEEISKAGKLLADMRHHPGHPVVWKLCPKCGKMTTGWSRRYSCKSIKHEVQNPKENER